MLYFLIVWLEKPTPSARHRLEQICLQALRIQICSPEILIEPPSKPPVEVSLKEDLEASKRQKKNCSVLPDSDIPELVSSLAFPYEGFMIGAS